MCICTNSCSYMHTKCALDHQQYKHLQWEHILFFFLAPCAGTQSSHGYIWMHFLITTGSQPLANQCNSQWAGPHVKLGNRNPHRPTQQYLMAGTGNKCVNIFPIRISSGGAADHCRHGCALLTEGQGGHLKYSLSGWFMWFHIIHIKGLRWAKGRRR